MNTITAICLICCTLIICSFIFFTIVYISELKREKALRKLVLESNNKMQELLSDNKLPVIIMDIPTKQESPSNNKDKKERQLNKGII
jgi:hypothetical protein